MRLISTPANYLYMVGLVGNGLSFIDNYSLQLPITHYPLPTPTI
ncbi:MAG TPA: hypothetical protein V6D25_28305 [Leptolyngbyaceae cyanobacterium]